VETPELIADALKATGWTRAELARQAGIPQSVLSAYEHRSREPSVAALGRILAAAGRELRAGPGSGSGSGSGVGPGRPGPGRAASLVGAPLAALINGDTLRRAADLRTRGVAPTLAVIAGSGDGASARYVRGLRRSAERVEVDCELVEVSGSDMIAAVAGANRRPDVHGVVIQTPLPPGLRAEDVAAGLDPAKDVDGAGVSAAGRLALRLPAFAPATATAVIELLAHHGVALEGRKVVVIGRSNVVGRPLAQLLTDRHATVTICHSRTPDLPSVTAGADVVVAAVGRAGLVGPAHVGAGAVVIDVGTNVGVDGVLRGDVDPAVAWAGPTGAGVAGLSPVPGGVGPVTTAVLLRHTVDAAERVAE
jgi:methylenetetrahydrofolate dehydrogenase (NADP+)/methenyltetrahydrofolate cyclohydrolase